MARPRNHAKHLSAAVQGLVASLTSLLTAVSTASAGRTASAGSAAPARAKGQRGPGKNNPKLKAAIKASWARMTLKERKARVRRMLAGRGLKPKRS